MPPAFNTITYGYIYVRIMWAYRRALPKKQTQLVEVVNNMKGDQKRVLTYMNKEIASNLDRNMKQWLVLI